jgi:hypothetical protein
MAIDTSYIRIDFEVLRTNSCKFLKVLDLSNWAAGAEHPSYIEITTPGASKAHTLVFQKEKLNIYNSNNLNLSDVTDYSSLSSLPDGIYKLTILQCANDPNAITKYHLQDCQIRCKVARKLISVDLLCEPCRGELLKEIQDITLFLDAAQAQADKCNINKAMEYYRRASTLLDRVSDGSCTDC